MKCIAFVPKGPYRNGSLMRRLANLIENELQKQEICALYNSQLARVWPQSMGVGKRKQQIKRFARKNDLAVTFYDVGLCAIFEKAGSPSKSSQPTLFLRDGELGDGEAKKSPRRRRL